MFPTATRGNSASTTTVNSFAISKPFISQKIKFKDVKRGTVEWRVADITTFFQSTAAYFEVTGYFHYSELMPGKQDTVHRYITWPLGSGESEKLYNSTDRYYLITYTPEAIYDVLESNDYLKNNSPSGVKRWFDKFEFKVSAIGDELYNYHIINNSSSAIQDVPNYSNVENGIGLVSTRISKSIRLTIEETSRKKVCEDFNYGFIYDPNR